MHLADALAFCAWARSVGRRAAADRRRVGGGRARRRRPAVAVGRRLRPERCACAEAAGAGPRRSPRTRRAPAPAAPSSSPATSGSGSRTDDDDGWRAVRGGSYLDHGWGLRAARALPADPERATPTTGFRIAIDQRRSRDETGATGDRRAARRLRPLLRRPRHQHRRHGRRRGRPRRRRRRRGRPRPDHRLVPVRGHDVQRHPRPPARLDGVEAVDVQVVWDPVWTPDRLSASAREKLRCRSRSSCPTASTAREERADGHHRDRPPGAAASARSTRSSSTASATSSTSTRPTRSARPASCSTSTSTPSTSC